MVRINRNTIGTEVARSGVTTGESDSPVLSVEFFPPKTEQGVAILAKTRDELAAIAPAYASVTFGAGGTTRSGTMETVTAILREDPFPAAPHISCIGATRTQIAELLDRYLDLGVRRVVALRGDLPSGSGSAGGDFRYANELVSFIRETTGDRFIIEVGCYPEMHPQALSVAADLENFRRKVSAGADAAISQYFFNPDAYFRFVDDVTAMGVTIPIVPGVMPITNHTQLARFSDACGAEIPRWIRKRLEGYGDDLEAIRAFGEEVTIRLVGTLLEGGAPGVHFYTMNRSGPTLAVARALGLGPDH